MSGVQAGRAVRGLSVTLVTLVLGFAGYAAVEAVAFAPTPTSPVYGGIPGALPPSFRYVYNDSYRAGRQPQHAQHPVRGSFLDPRGKDDTGLSGYHFGIDISVDDHHPEPGAPPLLSHRVYALESGTVSTPANVLTKPCLDRRLEVGHFAYWHVSPIVTHDSTSAPDSRSAGPASASGTSTSPNGRSTRANSSGSTRSTSGGHLAPYTDTAPPVVNALMFVTPPARPWLPTVSLAQPDTSTQLQPSDLHGLVELRANIDDPQSFLGFLTHNPAWPTDFAPYRVTVQIRNPTGRTMMNRTASRPTNSRRHPSSSTTPRNDRGRQHAGMRRPARPAQMHRHLLVQALLALPQEYWNTRTVPNGRYTVTVRAYDLAGNIGTQTALGHRQELKPKLAGRWGSWFARMGIREGPRCRRRCAVLIGRASLEADRAWTGCPAVPLESALTSALGAGEPVGSGSTPNLCQELARALPWEWHRRSRDNRDRSTTGGRMGGEDVPKKPKKEDGKLDIKKGKEKER